MACAAQLHPLFGAGEDRNLQTTSTTYTDAVLHPLFGAGEDRNLRAGSWLTLATVLHPLFGAGEDRNRTCSTFGWSQMVAAPALRSG